MMSLLSVAGFGILGVVARYGCHLAAHRLFPGEFPAMTLAINVLGSLLIGVVAGFPTLHPALRAGIAVGFLGGFTTFSAYSLEVVRLIESARYLAAVLYLGLSPLLGVGAAYAGLMGSRYFFAGLTVMK